MASVVASSVSVEQALSAMRGKRAVLLGDLVLDAYLYGETVRVSREAPVLVVRQERVEHRLGGGANTAANLAALGVQTEVIGVLGADDGAQALEKLLREAGADVSHVRTAATSTPVKTRVLAGAFGTSRQQVLRIDAEPSAHTPEVLEALAADLETRGRSADVVVISDYGYGLATPALAEAARRLVQSGVPVCVDSRYQFELFKGVTAVTPNAPETEALVGMSLSAPDGVARAGRAALDKLECAACLITQGRHGMTLFQRGVAPLHVDIVGDDEVTDVTGAGDTVIATFSAALAAGLGMPNGMRLANVAAGVVVGKLGTATASPEEISAAARRHAVELEAWTS